MLIDARLVPVLGYRYDASLEDILRFFEEEQPA
jgi:hypothetical protein